MVQGKTTLLNIISGRYMPSSGELYYESKNLTQVHSNKRASLGIGRHISKSSFI